MGQQQLLLLVLATVIVGLATVAGIQAFEQGQTRANQDALTSTAVKIASDVQARIKEPSQFGGYDGSLSDAAASDGVTMEELGYNTDSNNEYDAADGTCGIVKGGSATAGSISRDEVESSDVGSPDIEVLCESNENEVLAGVSGTNSGDIVSAAATLGS